MSIYFRCSDAFVTEHFLHSPQVCAAFDQVRCK